MLREKIFPFSQVCLSTAAIQRIGSPDTSTLLGGFASRGSRASLRGVSCLHHPWSHPCLPTSPLPGELRETPEAWVTAPEGGSGKTHCQFATSRKSKPYMPKPARPFIPKATWKRDRRDERSQGTLQNSGPQRKGFSNDFVFFASSNAGRPSLNL